jgi:hypothetical protein
MNALDPRCLGIDPLDFGPEIGKILHGDLVAPGDEDQIGSTQPFERLSKQSAGEQMPPTKRVRRVEQDDIEVPCKSAVLESVVQKQDLHLELLDGKTSVLYAVGGLQVRNIWQQRLELPGLVVEPVCKRSVTSG